MFDPKRLPSNFLFQNLFWIIALAGIILATTVAFAWADCVDAFATVERVLPLTWGWVIFSIIWFLALSASTTIRKEKLPCIPGFFRAVLFVGILVVIGFLSMGPAPMFLLFLLSIIGMIGAFLKKAKKTAPLFKKDMKVIGGFVLLTMLVLGSGSFYIRSTRTLTDYILRWHSTYPGRVALSDLLNSGPETLPDLRVMVEKGSPGLIVQAAERLAVIGERQVDVPLLLDALTSMRSRGDTTGSEKVENALRRLSGLEIPENTAVKTWREAWQKNLKNMS